MNLTLDDISVRSGEIDGFFHFFINRHRKELLPTRGDACKAAARLELLLSSAPCDKEFVRAIADFEIIDAPQPSLASGGCGFLPEELLTDMLGIGNHSKSASVIRVRIVSPTLGIFKGVFCRKRGISRRQW